VRLLGLHLEPRRGAGPSALADVGVDGRLDGLHLLGGDDEVLASLPPGPALLVVDAPLWAPVDEGSRDVERVLAWCDAPTLPISESRLRRVYGSARGVELAPRLAADGRTVTETLPELVLRQLAWEATRPAGRAPLPLEDYRTLWAGVRPPAVEPGRRRTAGGPADAAALLAGVLDLVGWAPAASGGTGQEREDAARLRALACAAVAWRRARLGDAATVVLGTPERGELTLAADAELRARVAVNLARLRAEGRVRI
jgi:hypothetical protein